MATFYGTFMQHQAFKNHVVQIEAESNELARQAMFTHFGDKFFTVYAEANIIDSLDKYPWQYNLLCKIQVIDHKSSLEYKLVQP